MGLRFFVVPVRDPSAFEQELNGFLARHKVVSIDRHLIDQGVSSFWASCVDYLSHAQGEAGHKVPTCRVAASTTNRSCLRTNSWYSRGCENCERNWPRPEPNRSTRCLQFPLSALAEQAH
jgi:hypothetical protein